jgi:hypothetical protein
MLSVIYADRQNKIFRLIAVVLSVVMLSVVVLSGASIHTAAA